MIETMGPIKLSSKEKIRHFLYWLVIIFFLTIVDPPANNLFIMIISASISIFAYAFVYYSQFLWVFPKYVHKNNLKLYLYIFLILFVFLSILCFNFFVFNPIYDDPEMLIILPKYEFALNTVLIFTVISVVGFGNFQNRMTIKKIQEQNEIEKILLIKELGFFKTHFNSYTTFNFLSYCYHYVHETSKEAGEAIELFSDMLRHTMDSKPDEKVTLKKEMDYIEKFISLKKHLSKGICVELNVEGKINEQYILPRLLIEFVENAFKHGKTHSDTEPIKIKLYTTNSGFIFHVQNKKNKSAIPISTGIGQNNVKNQLDLFYKNKYKLDIIEDDENYSCRLTLTN